MLVIIRRWRLLIRLFPRSGMHAHAFALAVKRRGIDAENLRRFTETRRAHDDALDVLGFEFFERSLGADAYTAAAGPVQIFWKIAEIDFLFLGENGNRSQRSSRKSAP